VTVRRATAVDAAALARLRWRVEERHERGADRASFLEFFTDWVIDHLSTHVPFVVEVDGRLSGMAWLMLAARVPSPALMDRRTGDLQGVYVLPEMRNSGVGAALLDTILSEARPGVRARNGAQQRPRGAVLPACGLRRWPELASVEVVEARPSVATQTSPRCLWGRDESA